MFKRGWKFTPPELYGGIALGEVRNLLRQELNSELAKWHRPWVAVSALGFHLRGLSWLLVLFFLRPELLLDVEFRTKLSSH